jgi:hypothetical protein
MLPILNKSGFAVRPATREVCRKATSIKVGFGAALRIVEHVNAAIQDWEGGEP